MRDLLTDKEFSGFYSLAPDAIGVLGDFVGTAYRDADRDDRQKIVNILVTDAALLAVWTQAIDKRPIPISRLLMSAAIAKSDTFIDPPEPTCAKPLISGERRPDPTDIYFFTGDVHKDSRKFFQPESRARILRSPHIKILVDGFQYGTRLRLEDRLLHLKSQVYASEDISDAIHSLPE